MRSPSNCLRRRAASTSASAATRGLARRLHRRGIDVITESFRVKDTEGPLEAGELERWRDGAARLLAPLQETTDSVRPCARMSSLGGELKLTVWLDRHTWPSPFNDGMNWEVASESPVISVSVIVNPDSLLGREGTHDD